MTVMKQREKLVFFFIF